MTKKLLVFTLAAVMLFGVFCLTSCNKVNLADYKVDKKSELQDYADAKSEVKYTSESWIVLQQAAMDGKAAIEAATSKTGVDKAVSKAIIAIDKVDAKVGSMGIPLNDELRLEILNLYCSWAISEFGQEYPFKGSNYFFYYGQHSGFHVFKFAGWSFGITHEEEIDGFVFSYPGAQDIYAIREDIGGTLKTIYEEGYLMRSELEEIHKIHIAIFAA